MYDELYEQKVDLTYLNQYGRRENVEICWIPESVSQDELQKHILDVTKTMGVKVPPNGIHIVHRIGKSRNSRPRNVIVRFVNRQTAFSLLKNKRKLNNGRYKNYFITENLCPYNKSSSSSMDSIEYGFQCSICAVRSKIESTSLNKPAAIRSCSE